jgi:drug/metabolite transporter (DMT)-like permease
LAVVGPVHSTEREGAALASHEDDDSGDENEAAAQKTLLSSPSSASARGLVSKHSAEDDGGESAASRRWMIFWSSVSLVVAVASMSAVGPVFLYLQQRGVPPILACSWRNQTMVLFLLIPALIEWFKLPKAQRSWDALRIEPEDEDAAATADNQSPKECSSPPAPTLSSLSSSSSSHLLHHAHHNHHTTASSPQQQQQQVHVTLRTVEPPAAEQRRGWHVFWYLLVVCLTWAGSLVLWVVALPYTSTPRASLFCSTYPLLLVPYMKFVQRVPVSGGEVLGVAISFIGILVTEIGSLMEEETGGAAMVQDGSGTPSSTLLDANGWTNGQRQLYGDVLCIGSSLLLGLNILFAEKTRKVLPLFSYSLSSAVIVLLLLVFGALWSEDATLSTDPLHGVFGWMVGDMLWLNLAFGFVVGMIGVLGFNFAVKYVNPLIFSSTQLLDPGLTGLLSWAAGLEGWPSASTFLGIAIVTLGIGFITVYQHRREGATTVATEAAAAHALEEATQATQATAAGKKALALPELTAANPPLVLAPSSSDAHASATV